MKLHGIDGTFDIYFFPINNPEIEGASYVSYLINNTADKNIKSVGSVLFLQAHTASAPSDSPLHPPFSSFTLNPSNLMGSTLWTAPRGF